MDYKVLYYDATKNIYAVSGLPYKNKEEYKQRYPQKDYPFIRFLTQQEQSELNAGKITVKDLLKTEPKFYWVTKDNIDDSLSYSELFLTEKECNERYKWGTAIKGFETTVEAKAYCNLKNQEQREARLYWVGVQNNRHVWSSTCSTRNEIEKAYPEVAWIQGFKTPEEARDARTKAEEKALKQTTEPKFYWVTFSNKDGRHKFSTSLRTEQEQKEKHPDLTIVKGFKSAEACKDYAIKRNNDSIEYYFVYESKTKGRPVISDPPYTEKEFKSNWPDLHIYAKLKTYEDADNWLKNNLKQLETTNCGFVKPKAVKSTKKKLLLL